jgi:hypothetical protein
MTAPIYEVLSEPGRFKALPEDHPVATSGEHECPVCGVALKAGDVPTFVNGKPADAEEAVKAAEGRAYNALVQLAHESCAEPYR